MYEIMTYPEAQEQIRKMREYPELLERNQEYWTDEEREQLRIKYGEGYGITEIALMLQRTETAVVMQLTALDLIQRSASRSRVPKTCRCLCATCDRGPEHPSCPRKKEGT